ncbi:hypothetical protein [Amphritea sp.]|uniref:hypothetical protein n=1 Tax=Amphritea sp. TaxID=1872502 RepID=UPI003A8E9248
MSPVARSPIELEIFWVVANPWMNIACSGLRLAPLAMRVWSLSSSCSVHSMNVRSASLSLDQQGSILGVVTVFKRMVAQPAMS